MEHKCAKRSVCPKLASNRLSKTHLLLAVCNHAGMTTCPGMPLFRLVFHSETLTGAGRHQFAGVTLQSVQSCTLHLCTYSTVSETE